MTALSSSFGSASDVTPRTGYAVGAVSFAVAAVWIVIGAHEIVEVSSMLATAAVATVVAFGVVVPRGLRSGGAPRAALTMAALGLLLIVPAFWSGLPMVLGAAGALLGWAGRRADRGSRMSIAAAVVGLLAVAGYLATYLTDQLM